MAREIKFRGKRVDNGEWVYGHLVADDHYFYYIVPCGTSMMYQDCGDELLAETARMVNSKTVGQFTGLKDKNGVDIYEGDIIKGSPCTCPSENQPQGNYDVAARGGGYYPFLGIGNECSYDACSGCSGEFIGFDCLVIGNIHDNPELMKGGI